MTPERRDPRGEVDEEIAWHLDRVTEELVGAGWTEEAARAEARRRFGDVDRYRRGMVRLERGVRRMRAVHGGFDAVRRHLGFAVRSLRRSPGYTLSVVLTLALGIGANATMLQILDRLFLASPSHVVDAERVRTMYVRRAFVDNVVVGRTQTLPDIHDLAEVPGIESVAAWTSPSEETLTLDGDGVLWAELAMAEPRLMPLLGTPIRSGRMLVDADDAADAPPVALVSETFAEARLGGTDAALGRTLTYGPTAFEIVGVLPGDFTGPGLSRADVWLPLRAGAMARGNVGCYDSRGCWWVWGVVRLAEGEGVLERATAAATTVHRQARADEPTYDPGAEVILAPLQAARGPRPSDESQVAMWLGAVAFIVLLIACANVANLMLVRAARRRHELAVRAALGVGRGGLLAGLLVETAVLAALGTGAALALAHFGGGLLQTVLIPNVYFPPTPWARLLTFALLATGLTLTLAALYPAAAASRTAPAKVLRSARSGGRSGGVRRALLVGQAALSAVLIVGAVLFLGSFRQADSLDLGWDRKEVALASLEFDGDYSVIERTEVHARALERLRASPAVVAASPTYSVPFRSSFAVDFDVPGLDSLPRLPTGGPYVNAVDADYFETMGIELERGRGLTAVRLGSVAPFEVVINRAMAEAYWPGEDPVGRCVHIGGEEEPCTTVVGIVADHRRSGLEEETTGLYYVAIGHPSLSTPPQSLMIRTTRAPDESTAALREALAGLDARVRFAHVQPLENLVSPYLQSWRLGAVMLTLFGALALAVAGVGLYGVLAYDVASRRRELGVRAALGAAMGELITMVLRDAVVLTTVGIVLGGGLAALAAPRIAPLLFQVSPYQPIAYAAMAVTLLGTAIVAGTLPAWRSARVDPSEVLREE
ncbi:ABC transporter permease [Gemmatimonadota bacterium Y43]|uniref:ABC transporter permease n=1 Tax=Gaopeijia maritima TaxID=3119007 RepID=UPI00328CD89F